MRRLRREPTVVSQGRRQRRRPGEDATAPAKGLGHFLMRRFGLVVLLIALLASAINVLSLSSDARVVPLTADGSQSFLKDTQVYQTAADKLLAGSVWNRNKLTVNTDGISHQLLKEFPELSDVSVTLPLLSKRPTVYVQTAQPALVLVSVNGSFILDTDGKALLNAADLQAQSRQKLPLVTDQSGLDVTLNQQALPSDNVSFIRTVAAELAARHVGISAMVLPRGTSELDVHISNQPYFVKFNLQSGSGDAREQAGTFLATQSQLQRQNVTPSQYIDVRVDGRAYYK